MLKDSSGDCEYRKLSGTDIYWAWFLCSMAQVISHCWFWVRIHASELALCLAAAMFLKLFFLDKNTISGMFTVRLKNKTIGKDQYGRTKFWRENVMKSKANIIYEKDVDLKETSNFCLSILWSLQQVWQFLHISLREWFSSWYVVEQCFDESLIYI